MQLFLFQSQRKKADSRHYTTSEMSGVKRGMWWGALTVVTQQQTCLPVFIHINGRYKIYLQAQRSQFSEIKDGSEAKGQIGDTVFNK